MHPLLILLLGLIASSTNAFHLASCGLNGLQSSRARPVHSSSLHLAPTRNDIEATKAEIQASISCTDRGRSTSQSQKNQIHAMIAKLEQMCPLPEPARDKRMDGPWVVLYTDAPPPSNGQLLFLKGIAKQVIDLNGGRYRNELYVGGSGVDEDQDAWLKAVLEARWEVWDGVYLDNSGDKAPDDDFGGTTWKVTFESLKISVFEIPLFTQQFKEGTARTWKMTYLDDDTRVVRAGKTGREEDDVLFYMRRGK